MGPPLMGVSCAAGRAPPPLEPLRRAARYLLAPLATWRLGVRRIQGRTAAGERASMLVAGDGSTLRSLVARVLPADRSVVDEGSLALPRLLVALRRADPGELVVARVPSIVGDLLDRAPWLRMPEAIDLWAPLAAVQERRARHDSVRGSDRRWRRAGLTWAFTAGDEEFDTFYDAMYVPFAQAMFAERALIRPRAALRRHAALGGMIWVLHGGERVAGAVVTREGDALHVVSLGTCLAPARARELGCMAAVFSFGCDLASSVGAGTIDFGGAVPWLDDGAVRAKRVRGGRLGPKRSSNRVHLLAWQSESAAVRALLALIPLVVSRAGELTALARIEGSSAPAPEVALALHRRMGLPGLARFAVVASPEGAQDVPAGGPIRFLQPGSSGEIRQQLDRLDPRCTASSRGDGR
ncbi:MAG TPA: hypothetical protein VFG43_13550 [Geminicoccaceae bacterium]|nr:hypothetical protein [Geminicoccaceae bacterium]